ncbi:MAG: hypothetical protein LIP11_19035 [Clostridiales bacterium]|nr:hypothetical protein [Clostridiales bacterium]
MFKNRIRKSLSVLLAVCLIAGMIPDAVFAQEDAGVVDAEVTTEAASEAVTASEETGGAETADTGETQTEAATETTNTETEAETDATAAETDGASGETESEAAQETEADAETEAEAETEMETEAETETATLLLGSTAAPLCDNGNDADTCVICKVEALIDELPGVDEIAQMDAEEQNDVYTQASDICDIYYDELTEDEQE